jgi:Flp pilus assembly protein CpaB
VIGAVVLLLAARILVPGVVDSVRGTAPALTAARALPAGHLIAESDLTLAHVGAGLIPAGVLTDPAAAIGQRAATALPAGMPLTPELLAGPGPLAQAPPGAVVVPVRLSDRAAAALLAAGDRIDVLASAGAAADGRIVPAQKLAAAALVLSVPDQAETSDPGLVLLALTEAEAALVGGAASWSVLSAVVVG